MSNTDDLIKLIHNAVQEDKNSMDLVKNGIDELINNYQYSDLDSIIRKLDLRAMDVHTIHRVLFQLKVLKFTLPYYYNFYSEVVKELSWRNVCFNKTLVEDFYSKFGVEYV